MSKSIEDFFTAGELATLFNIPKQTLLYYDRIGLLSPEFIAGKWSSHYSFNTIFNFRNHSKFKKIRYSYFTDKRLS